MTNEKAILILRNNKPTSDTRLCGKELCEAVDIAIEALEKQIPKKPNGRGRFYTNNRCPNCGCSLNISQDYGGMIHCEFCLGCGQAISWEDEDDK